MPEAITQEQGEVGSDEAALQDRAPDWLFELLKDAGTNGFYEKINRHAAIFVERSKAQLVISFDNLSDAGNPHYNVSPWASKFAREKAWSHLGLIAPGSSWYREAGVIDLFSRLQKEGFFEGFERVALIGTSMGAFAALVFADFVPGATVVALSPQTTLDKELVPWEKRFRKGQAQDWSLPYSDAANTIDQISKAYVLYDPWLAEDRWHVERLNSDKIVPLKGFWFGHKTAVILRRMECLKPFIEQAVTGTLTEDAFYKMARRRKDLLLYRRVAEADLNDKGREDLVDKFRSAFQSRRRRQIAAQNG